MARPVTKANSSGINWRQFSTSPGAFGKSFGITLAAIAGVLLLVLPRISEVLPKVLGDELLYSQNARLLGPGEWFLPNYLFNWIFGSTNVCGYGFYSCGKSINVFLLLGFGFVIYATARLILKPSLSLFIAFATCVGPIAVYASYFTPDMMFYLAMAIVVFVALQLNHSSPWLHWLTLGAALAVASVVKPHALFALPAIVMYCLFLALSADDKKFIFAARNMCTVLASTISLKLALGFALAGTNGLSLFGSYGKALESAASSIAQNNGTNAPMVPPSNEGSSAGTGTGTSSTTTISGEVDFGSMAAWELVLHIGFLVIAFSLPLLVASRRISQAISAQETNQTSAKLSFLAISILTMGVASTAIYTAVAPSWGEILDYRLMIRYYEYVLPFLVIAALINIKSQPESKGLVRQLVISVAAIGVAVLATTKLATVVPPLYTDSTLFSGLYFSNISIWIFTAISAGLLLFALKYQAKAAKYWVFGWLPAVTVIVAISTQIGMTGPSSIKGLYTTAAQTTHSLLSQEQRDSLIVVGNFKNNVQAAQLWIDSKSVQGMWIDRGENLNVDSLAPEAKYVLIIGEMNISGSFEVLKKDDSFAIIKRI